MGDSAHFPTELTSNHFPPGEVSTHFPTQPLSNQFLSGANFYRCPLRPIGQQCLLIRKITKCYSLQQTSQFVVNRLTRVFLLVGSNCNWFASVHPPCFLRSGQTCRPNPKRFEFDSFIRLAHWFVKRYFESFGPCGIYNERARAFTL